MSLTHKPDTQDAEALTEERLAREARRVLRRLGEAGAVLAVSAEMDKAVVVRDCGDGRSTRTAVVDRDIAEALALKDWIATQTQGRVRRYKITPAGRAALNRLMAEGENRALGFAEAQTPFAMAGAVGHAGPSGDAAADPQEQGKRHRLRYGLTETPLAALARRRDSGGMPFLGEPLLRAGERLREDFELAQLPPRTAQNWDRFLSMADTPGALPSLSDGRSTMARQRVLGALRDLGPGLGDVALRCCCHLEGLESAERNMGWSARSGKIVLRIALQRLRHYYDRLGDAGDLIG